MPANKTASHDQELNELGDVSEKVSKGQWRKASGRSAEEPVEGRVEGQWKGGWRTAQRVNSAKETAPSWLASARMSWSTNASRSLSLWK